MQRRSNAYSPMTSRRAKPRPVIGMCSLEHRPLSDYLLLYGWTLVFGTSDVALRLFSTACSLACLPFLAGIARRTGGRGSVLPACILFALSPLAVYYSTEGRMYSLLWFCVFAVAWSSLMLRQGGGIALYLLWIAMSAAGFLTHYFFLFPWIAMVAFLLIQPGNLSRKHLAIIILFTILVILPWYANLPESLGHWRITLAEMETVAIRSSGCSAPMLVVFAVFSGRAASLWEFQLGGLTSRPREPVSCSCW